MMLWKMEEQGRKLLLKLIEKYVRKGNNLLEIGCGDDAMINKLSSMYGISAKCIDPYGYGKNVIKIEGERVDELNEKFDIIYSIMSFHHLSNPEKFFDASLRVMKENAIMIIVDWKKGVNTGFPEYYFDVEEVISMMDGYKIIEHGNERYHFYAVATKSNQQNIY